MKKNIARRFGARAAAVAALSVTLAAGFATASQADTDLCRDSGFACTPGYDASHTGYNWVENYYGNSWANYAPGGHNCTRYAAFRLAQNGLPDPGGSFGNAGDWDQGVPAWAVTDTPAVGSIAQWDANAGHGSLGHVAYVEWVSADGNTIRVREDNWGSDTTAYREILRSGGWPSNFIHLADLFTSAPELEVVGTGQVDSQLTVSTSGGWSPSPDATVYQWFRGSQLLATGYAYTPVQADIGHVITVKATATKQGHQSKTVSAGIEVYGASFAFSGPTASISGTAKVEYTLSSGSAISTTGANYSITWLRNGGVRQDGGSTLTLTSADIGTTIQVRYTYSKPGYKTQSYTSSGVAIAGYSSYSFNGAPAALSGTAKVEYTLSASSGLSTTGVTTTIQWFKNGVLRQSGGNTLLLGSGDIGSTITVRYTFNKLGYATTTYTSPGVVVAGYSSYSFSGAPAAISGTRKVGYTLTATSGLQTSGVTVTYQWYRNGVAVSGRTGKTYALTSTDKGKSITVRIYFDKQGYQATSSLSAAATIS